MKTKIGLIVMACVLAGSALAGAGPGQGLGPYPHGAPPGPHIYGITPGPHINSAPPMGSLTWALLLAFAR
jgi:hypothetical protein